MPSSPSTRLRVELQAAGENLNTWGAPKLNAALQRLEEAIDGRCALVLAGPVTLTSSNYVADQARMAFLDCTGIGATITIPSVEKLYVVRNATSGPVIVTTGAGTTATIAVGDTAHVVCDATNVYLVKAFDFGGSKITNVATPVASTDAATKGYADNLVFSATLPGQTGNAGYFLQTNGSAPSWTNLLGAAVTFTGVHTHTAAVNFAASASGGAGVNLAVGVAPSAPNNGDLWTTSVGVFARIGGATQQFAQLASNTFTAIQTFPAATTAAASLNVPPGVAPTSPNNGDLWTTALGMFARINGGTVKLGSLTISVSSWAPTLSFDTPGDLSVSYGTQVGTVLTITDGTTTLTFATFQITTSAFTFSTASGDLRISLPTTPNAAFAFMGALFKWSGLTGLTTAPGMNFLTTAPVALLVAGANAANFLTNSNVTSGTQVTLNGAALFRS